MPKKKRANGAGTTRQLASGRWQARHRGPDGVLRPAPITFDTRLDADAWLRRQAGDVELGLWSPPEQREAAPRQTLAQYAETWLATRELKPRTRHEYRALLDALIVPALGDAQLDRIAPATVRLWYAQLDASTPTRRAHAYSLLRSIFASAVADDLRADNPCRIRGAGKARKQHATAVASLAELEVIVGAMPPRYRAMVLLAAWCGLRFGELAELRRRDVDLEGGVVRVSRGVTRTKGAVHVGDPKSEAGRRPVSIPPHLLVALAHHLEQHVDAGRDALLFPARGGQHLVPSSLYRVWYPAREAAGRPDLRFHDLRHTGATLAAATGATLKELMARLGHSTPQAALVYQHAAADRDRAIAEALSGLAGGTVIPLHPRQATSA
jgi:integrase